MPLLPQSHASLAAVPSDTGVPQLTRRRVWKAPDVASHSLVVLTRPRLYLTPAGTEPRADADAVVEKAIDVEAVLGPFVTTVDLAAVVRVRHDLTRNAITLDYTAAPGDRSRRGSVEVVFTAAEPADALFSKLWRRLGDGFRLEADRGDLAQQVRGPAVLLAGLFTATLGLSIGLNALDDIAAAGRWDWAAVLPGWKSICAVGGAAAAAVTVEVVRRVTRPPERLELSRD